MHAPWMHCQCQSFIAIYYRFGVNFLFASEWCNEEATGTNRFTLPTEIASLFSLQIMKMTKTLFKTPVVLKRTCFKTKKKNVWKITNENAALGPNAQL